MKNIFSLPQQFLAKYKSPRFTIIGNLIYQSCFSQLKSNGEREVWTETVERLVNRVFRQYVEFNKSKTDYTELATDMYDKMFNMKFLPYSNSWVCDKNFSSCAFVSTELVGDEHNVSKPFVFCFDKLLHGHNITFDTKLVRENLIIQAPLKDKSIKYRTEDPIELVKLLLDSYFFAYPHIDFDYTAMKTNTNIEELHKNLMNILNRNVGKKLDTALLIDIISSMNKESKLNIICELSDITKNLINTSVYTPLGIDYSEIEGLVKDGVELLWLENMRKYERMDGQQKFKDYRVEGTSTGLTLESYEQAPLIEIFLNNHSSLEEFKDTLQLALLYAKIGLMGNFWEESEEVVKRNSRVGCSLSGIAQFLTRHSLHTLKEWCGIGYTTLQSYNSHLSSTLGIPRSIKLTCISSDQLTSLLAGATTGLNYPEYRTYIQEVKVNSDDLIHYSESKGCVVENGIVKVPVKWKMKTKKDQSIWEQLNLMAFLQKYWADNQINCTIHYKDTDNVIEALNYFQYQLKSLHLLPDHRIPEDSIKEITDEEYSNMIKKMD